MTTTTMPELLDLDDIEALYMSLHSHRPASHLAAWEIEGEPTILETGSRIAYEYSTNAGLIGPSLKTFLDFLLLETEWYYGIFSGAWNISAIGRSCLKFHLQPLEPLTSDIESGLLPTPVKNDANQVQFPRSQGLRHRGSGLSLITWLMQQGLQPPAKPHFWEFMMGCPPGWTSKEQTVLPSWETLLIPALSAEFLPQSITL